MNIPHTTFAQSTMSLLAMSWALIGGSALAEAPASVGANWKINGNGYPGDLAISQAADGRLTGSVYGQTIEGYYSPGAGNLAFVRYQSGKPYQVFIGTVSPGKLGGQFYPLGPDGGATPGRLSYDWSATLVPAFIGPGVVTGTAIVPPPPPLLFSGHTVTPAPAVNVDPQTEATVVAQCPAGKVVSGYSRVRPYIAAGAYIIEATPTQDGSGMRFTAYNGALLNVNENPGLRHIEAICIDRPEGYEITLQGQALSAGQRAVVEVGCPAGKVLIGGGTRTQRTVYTAASGPRADGGAWQAHFRNDLKLPGGSLAQVFGICVSDRYAGARSLVSSPDANVGQGGILVAPPLSCNNWKGLSAGVHSSATTIGHTGPSLDSNGSAWGVNISNQEADLATVGLRALCGSFQ